METKLKYLQAPILIQSILDGQTRSCSSRWPGDGHEQCTSVQRACGKDGNDVNDMFNRNCP